MSFNNALSGGVTPLIGPVTKEEFFINLQEFLLLEIVFIEDVYYEKLIRLYYIKNYSKII
jgi:hypothetical protein